MGVLRVIGRLIVLAGVAIAVLWPAPFDRRVLPAGDGQSDVMISHWPSAVVLARSVARDHRLPLWNPAYGGGRPMAADPLAALFYPPTQLVHLLSFRDFFLVLMLGHLIFAGVGMYLLAQRAAGLSPPAALVAALAFEASPRLIGHLGAGHLTMIQTAAWLPWVALACWTTIQKPARGAVLLGISMALLVLAGHPQLAYYACMMCGGMSLWLLVRRGREHGRAAVLRSVAGLIAAALLAAVLAAIHLLPLLEFMAHSTRQNAVRVSDTIGVSRLLVSLAGIREPTDNPHEGLFEPGLVVLALAVVGACLRFRRAWPWLLAIALVTGLAMGNGSPLYHAAAFVLPGYDRFRGLGRIWFVALLPIALLAGLGAQSLIERVGHRFRRATLATGVALTLLVAANLAWTNRGLARVTDVTWTMQPSEAERSASLLAGKRRIYGVQRNMRQISAAALGSRLADGWDPLLIEPYVTFMRRAGGYQFSGYQLSVPPFEVYDAGYPTTQDAQPDAALLGLVNVEVVLSRTPLRDARLRQVAQIDDMTLYRNTANAGPAYVVAPDANDAPPTIDTLQRLPDRAVVRERTVEHLTITVTSKSGGYLVIGTPAYPGWVATLDDAPAPLTTIEGILPALRIPAGRHVVTYQYCGVLGIGC